MRVAILGCTGMLGSMLVQVVSSSGFQIVGTIRANKPEGPAASIEWRFLDAEGCTVEEVIEILHGCDWAINAIGIIKPHIRDNDPIQVERAIRVNALFPYMLSKAAEKTNTNILQIATDCVYSGMKGRYVETDNHDPLDVYGKTKSLGEVTSHYIRHLRCSIVGPEPKTRLSLLNWFLGQEQNAEINGFTNHGWNGITTLHFAKLCVGIIRKDLALRNLHHVVPNNVVTKYELLRIFAEYFARSDLRIVPKEATEAIDRTLDTLDHHFNLTLWQAAGYSGPPTISEMVSELASRSGIWRSRE